MNKVLFLLFKKKKNYYYYYYYYYQFDCVTNRRKKHHARGQTAAEPPPTDSSPQQPLFLADSSYIGPCLSLSTAATFLHRHFLLSLTWPLWRGFICILYSKDSLSSKIVSVQANSEQGGWISEGDTQRSLSGEVPTRSLTPHPFI